MPNTTITSTLSFLMGILTNIVVLFYRPNVKGTSDNIGGINTVSPENVR